jgi:hypothetical protein
LRAGACLFVLATAACAPAPDSIAPAPLPPQIHGHLGCADLLRAQSVLNRRVAALSAEQTQTRNDDMLAIAFTLRPLASQSGGDLQDRLALAKGERAAVNQRIATACDPAAAPPLRPAGRGRGR